MCSGKHCGIGHSCTPLITVAQEEAGSPHCCWPAGRTGGPNNIGQWFVHASDTESVPCKWQTQYCGSDLRWWEGCNLIADPHSCSCNAGVVLPCTLTNGAPFKKSSLTLMAGNWTDTCLNAYFAESARLDISTTTSLPMVRRSWMRLREVYCTPECGYNPTSDTVTITNASCSASRPTTCSTPAPSAPAPKGR